jgi:hypothetical protein
VLEGGVTVIGKPVYGKGVGQASSFMHKSAGVRTVPLNVPLNISI